MIIIIIIIWGNILFKITSKQRNAYVTFYCIKEHIV